VTEQTPRAPEGWYDDPELAGHLRWWDGYQWTLRKPIPAPRRVRSIGAGFSRLGQALGVLLVLDLLVAVARVALYGWGVTGVIHAVEVGDIDTATTFDDFDRSLRVGQLVGVVVTGVVWMVWQFRLARATQGLARTPAMHAFSWIIPVGALWLPFQNVRDLWNRVLPDLSSRVLGWWWAGWLASEILARVLARGGRTIDSLGEARTLLWISLAAASVSLVTAVLAVRIVRTLARGSLTAPAVNRAA
jgi:hypothetical protein